MVQYTKTSTGKTAIVGSKHVIDGRQYEVEASGKLKLLGKVPKVPERRPDSAPAKSAKPMASKKAAAPMKPKAKAKPMAPELPSRRPDTVKPTMLPDGRKPVTASNRPAGFSGKVYVGPGKKDPRRGYKTGGGF